VKRAGGDHAGRRLVQPGSPEHAAAGDPGPITRWPRPSKADSKTAVLVLGHGDSSGAAAANQKLSLERAASVSAIFRLSGLQRDRLMLKGMGSVMPRAANDSAGPCPEPPRGNAADPKNTMVALLAK
jgi:hypothetical protein